MDLAAPFTFLCIFGACATMAVTQHLRARYGVSSPLVALGIFGAFMLGTYYSLT